MATYTQADLTSARTAYQKIIKGEKLVQISIGEKFFRFSPGDVAALKDLISKIELDLESYVARTYAKQGRRAS